VSSSFYSFGAPKKWQTLKEQHVHMQFCFKLGQHTVEDIDMLKKAFVEHK
jgi:hypothetical protein